MKAVVCTKYGGPDVLKLAEVEKPVPKGNEILVKVHATTVASGDLRVRGFVSPVLFWLPMRIVLGISKPRNAVLGVELAGEVVDVGNRVKRFKKGDRIFALTGMKFGGYAEYATIPEHATVARMPSNATYGEAAAIPFGGTSALYFLRKGGIRSGQRVLIYGASGSVGTSAVQLAKHFGAEVTAACSAANADFVKSLGADDVVDYAKEPITAGGKRYDLVLDAVGKLVKSETTNALAPGGNYTTVDGQGIAKVSQADLQFLKDLYEAGKLRAVIDRRYPLAQIPEAHRYVETGRKKGNVVIDVADDA
ncbi:NAD(P)-dependent alcohol dehydrogenase [Paenibacillus sp.]|uniref:NAD(P)-dependent alcohol dehydrogenase n=1 Tax=Paenibacillus sp. TaxID=58172 RepID=UPI002810E2F2|nr:NAD(P)-dependent alcohol dehydrogenase [Paenibacillus sp.]